MKYSKELHDELRKYGVSSDIEGRFIDPVDGAMLDEIERLQAELARRDEIIKRLKEDAIMLALLLLLNGKFKETELRNFHSVIDAHRALMKELE